jgi:DNA mismatch repair protein MSH5
MDEYYGDIYSLIIDREVEIIHQLRIKTLTYSPQLTAASRVLGELDWYSPFENGLTSLLSLAITAQKYSFTRPFISEENVINIVRGRHPLQELVVSTFIENDTTLAGGQDRGIGEVNAPSVVLLTGANYSGKSVYLKQVLSPLFIHDLGCSHCVHGAYWKVVSVEVSLTFSFVPAESAVIGITDKILTRVQTRESVSKVPTARDY